MKMEDFIKYDQWITHDIAFVGGTFAAVPHVLSSWAQRWVGLKEPWTSLLLTPSKQAYIIKYQPDPAALAFLNGSRNLPIGRVYFWPLEVAQQILKEHVAKHGPLEWSVFWLPPSLTVPPSPPTISMMVYTFDRPLFCRTLPHSANMRKEITSTQQYLKRFGYEQGTHIHVFAPDVVPPVKKIVAPLFAPSLARNRWLGSIPLAAKTILAAVIVIGGVWKLQGLYQQPKSVPAEVPPQTTEEVVPRLAGSAPTPISPQLYVTAIICEDNGWAVWINGKKLTNTDVISQHYNQGDQEQQYTIKEVTPSQVRLSIADGQEVIVEVGR